MIDEAVVAARVRLVLDRAADDEQRWDARMAFGNDPVEPDVPSWMSGLASRTDDDLQMQAAETIAVAWLTRDRFNRADRTRFDRLPQNSQDEVRAYFGANGRLDWLA